jgi:hypothetical protein
MRTVRKLYLNALHLRFFASQIYSVALIATTLSAADSDKGHLGREVQASQSTAVDLKSGPKLRLQGVASIGGQETAYFIHIDSGMVIGLGVGETLWQEYKLVSITDGTDFRRCKAVLSHKGVLFHIPIESFMCPSVVTMQVAPSISSSGSVAGSFERVAVRPWVDPKSAK